MRATATSSPPESTSPSGSAVADIAVDGQEGVDTATFARRELVPTERLLERGQTVQEQFEVRREERPPRPPLSQVVATLLRAIAPRELEGSKLPVFALAFVASFPFWDGTVTSVLLPEIRASFGVDLAVLLSIGNVAQVIAFGMAMPMGYLADRVKRVRMVQAHALASVASTIGVGAAPTVPAIVGARGAGGLAAGVGNPANYPLIADYYPVHNRARAFAIGGIFTAVAGVVAGPAAGHLADAFGWHSAFYALGVLFAVGFVLTLFLREPVRGYFDRLALGATEEVATHAQKPVTFSEGFRAALSISTLRRICFAIPFLVLVYQGLGSIVSLYYSQVFGLSASTRGNIATIQGVAGICGLMVAGPLADRLLRDRPARVMSLFGGAVILVGLVAGLMAFAPSWWIAVACSVPAFFVQAMVLPVALALVSLVVPARVRGLG